MILLRRWFLWLFVLNSWLQTPGLYVSTPIRDTTIAGVVEVIGSVPAENFLFAEVSYGYQNSSSPTWFQISKLDHVVQDGILARWDTTTITDGGYRLRVMVMYKNGSREEVIVDGLTVRNYSYELDSTTGDIMSVATITPEIMSKPTEYPTPLPINPVVINTYQVKNSLILGAVMGVILLTIFSIISYLLAFPSKK